MINSRDENKGFINYYLGKQSRLIYTLSVTPWNKANNTKD